MRREGGPADQPDPRDRHRCADLDRIEESINGGTFTGFTDDEMAEFRRGVRDGLMQVRLEPIEVIEARLRAQGVRFAEISKVRQPPKGTNDEHRNSD